VKVTKTTPFYQTVNSVKKVKARERIVPMMKGMVRRPPFRFPDSEDEEVPFSKRLSLTAPDESIFFPVSSWSVEFLRESDATRAWRKGYRDTTQYEVF